MARVPSTPAPTTSSPAPLDSTLSLAGTFNLKNASSDQISAAVSNGASSGDESTDRCCGVRSVGPRRSRPVAGHPHASHGDSIVLARGPGRTVPVPDRTRRLHRPKLGLRSHPRGTSTTCTGSSANYVRFNFDSLAPQQAGNFDTWWVLPAVITASYCNDPSQLPEVAAGGPPFGFNPVGSWPTGVARTPGNDTHPESSAT